MIKMKTVCAPLYISALLTFACTSAHAKGPKAADHDAMASTILQSRNQTDQRIRKIRRATEDQIDREKADWESEKLAALAATRDNDERERVKAEQAQKSAALQKRWQDLKDKQKIVVAKIKKEHHDRTHALKDDFRRRHPKVPATNSIR